MTAGELPWRSTAVVRTDRSERWIKQLSSHLGRKAEVRPVDGGQLLLLAGGSCLMTGDACELRLTASAPDEASLHLLQDVVGRHLERFAASEDATVTWQRASGRRGQVKAVPMTPELLDYVLAHSDPLDEVQGSLVEQTAELGDAARLQIAPEQGPLLTLLVRLTGARRAVEVGTFTGLSSLAIAKGLPDDGSLTCFDVSQEWTQTARRAWRQAGVEHKVELRLGDARSTLRDLPDDDVVDFAFVDADKDGYVDYLELLLPHLRTGGLLCFDNTLSRGDVLDPAAGGNAAAIRSFNARLAADSRLDKVLLPVADGLTLARKR